MQQLFVEMLRQSRRTVGDSSRRGGPRAWMKSFTQSPMQSCVRYQSVSFVPASSLSKKEPHEGGSLPLMGRQH